MNAKTYLYITLSALILSGCAANTTGVTPSQNTNLQAISPSSTAVSEGGAMQRSLDSWLKEEWVPLTTTPSQNEGTNPQIKSENGGNSVQSAVVAPGKEEDNTSYTLQKYADKWKTYQENKTKMNEGKPKEPSNIENLQKMPVIGK
ncbi:MAG: hypothetical protein PHQ22_07965 [Sulfuricurvum sp.]|nr:hypothetical protein [Sulfuricurvum sp.]